MIGHRVFMAGAVACMLSFELGTLVATSAESDTPCVPGYAINYDGPERVWRDRDGNAVLHAEYEDSYDWCTR
jgi:hypothetical protein